MLNKETEGEYMKGYCVECGKILPENSRFITCKECYFKSKNKAVEKEPSFTESIKNMKIEKGKGMILTKNVTIPNWLIISIFLLGVIIGAWLW